MHFTHAAAATTLQPLHLASNSSDPKKDLHTLNVTTTGWPNIVYLAALLAIMAGDMITSQSLLSFSSVNTYLYIVFAAFIVSRMRQPMYLIV